MFLEMHRTRWPHYYYTRRQQYTPLLAHYSTFSNKSRIACRRRCAACTGKCHTHRCSRHAGFSPITHRVTDTVNRKAGRRSGWETAHPMPPYIPLSINCTALDGGQQKQLCYHHHLVICTRRGAHTIPINNDLQLFLIRNGSRGDWIAIRRQAARISHIIGCAKTTSLIRLQRDGTGPTRPVKELFSRVPNQLYNYRSGEKPHIIIN